MSTPLLMIATLCYVITAFDLLIKGNAPLSWTFFAYAAANGGLLASIIRG